MPHLKKALTTNEMTSTRWPKFNDVEYLVKQIHQNLSWKNYLMDVLHYVILV
jgi:hypothetical protein